MQTSIPPLHLKQKNPQHRTYRKNYLLALAEAHQLYKQSRIQMLPKPIKLADGDRYNLKDQKPKGKDLQGGKESTKTIQISMAAGKRPGSSKSITLEALANRQNNDKNQGNDNTQNNQFDLHILEPHLSSHLGSLLPKVLCLQCRTSIITSNHIFNKVIIQLLGSGHAISTSQREEKT